MAYNKHVGIYSSMDEMENEKANGLLVSPWVAYINSQEHGFSVVYSNDMFLSENEMEEAEKLWDAVKGIKNSFITLTEDEYEKLISLPDNTSMMVTQVDGTQIEVEYSDDVFYYTYDPNDRPKEE